MAHIRKERPGGGPGGLEWSHPGQVIEVADPRVATELVRIPGGGFSEVIPEDDGSFSEIDDPGFIVNPQPVKRRPGRPRKNITPGTPIVEAAVPHHQIGTVLGHDVTGAPHAGHPVEHVAGDERGKTLAAQPGSDGRETPMVAPNAEALEAKGARDAAWHARAVTRSE